VIDIDFTSSAEEIDHRYPEKCLQCGRGILTTDSTSECMECHDFAHAFLEWEADAAGWLDSISYSEYLKSDHWSHIRQIKLEASGRRCATCSSTLQLHVHHREYPQNRLDIKPWMLVVLCKRCHDLLHIGGK
jgi:hypothetical protein